MQRSRALTRSASLFSIACASTIALAGGARSAYAQNGVARARLDGRAGDVTGLELSLEGARSAPRGARMRWLLNVHEVVGLSDLRPAPRVQVRLLSSLVRERALAEYTADALGRVEAELTVPLDAPDRFRVVFEAVSSRGVRRQFDLDVTATPPVVLTLDVSRTTVSRGETVRVWGFATSAVDQRAVANRELIVSMNDGYGRLAMAPTHVRTDAAGRYALDLPLTEGRGDRYTIEARTAGDEAIARTSTSVSVHSTGRPAIVVRAAPQQSVVQPGEQVVVDVQVRTGDGRALRNAAVRSPYIPRPRGDAPEPVLYTDARGRARFEFRVGPNGNSINNLHVPVSVTRAGLGDAQTSFSLRIAGLDYAGAVAVEGGALLPGLPGRVYVRVVRPDGRPAPAGVPVVLAGPRIAEGTHGVTDENGVATLETTLRDPATARRRPAAAPARATVRARLARAGDEEAEQDGAEGEAEEEAPPEDSCGGTTATSITASIGAAGPRQGTVSGCIAVDPDVPLRVRLASGSLAHPGQALDVRITRAAAVRGWPVELALIELHGSSRVPRTAVLVASGADRGALTIPEEFTGAFFVRARPVQPSLGQPARGSFVAGLSLRGGPVDLDAQWQSGAGLALRAQGALEGLSASVVLVPASDGDALYSRMLTRSPLAFLGDLRVPSARVGGALLEATLAARITPDSGAPAVLRAGRLLPQPAQEDPTEVGILRDPWRARGRFVEGRLARFFRSVEQHVADSLESRRDDVALRGPNGRWEFNRELLDALGSGDGEGGAPRAMGGGPLTIDVLRRLDPAFTYDAVARRITRRRAFMILLALRRFVNEHALDLRWSWRGDPTAWLDALVENSVDYDGNGSSIERPHLLDGWGTRFALRPAPGGRPRFATLAPVPGFELVSAGPDGRFGTGDDVFNPFARVLPSGGAYARAVDEDGLLARLNGVELGRATVSSLSEVFGAEGVDVSDGGDEQGTSALMDWNALPTVVRDDPLALELLRPGLRAQPIALHDVALAQGSAQVNAPLDDEPRSYAAVVEARGPAGQGGVAIERFTAGRPVLLDLPLVSEAEGRVPAPRLEYATELELPLTVTNLEAQSRAYRIVTSGDGVSTQGPETLTVPGGESLTVPLRVRGTRNGSGALSIELRDGGGALLRTVRVPVAIDAGGLGLRDDVSALARSDARDPARVRVDLRGAGAVRNARLVLVAPSALTRDPEFARTARIDPALLAWHEAMGARRPQGTLEARMYSLQQPDGRVTSEFASEPERGAGAVYGGSVAVSTACALLVWSGAPEDDARAAGARERAVRVLPGLRSGYTDEDVSAGRLRESAALLTALATGVGGEEFDVMAMMLAQVRNELRGALDQYATKPTLLARAAAALLLADPADEQGVALYERAKRAARNERDGSAWLAGSEERAGRDEELAATAALAVAAQQRGDTVLARALAQGVAQRAVLAMRLGGEPAFWLLAASAYGVFGLAPATHARVEGDGVTAGRVELREGVATVPVALGANTSPALTVRAEAANQEHTALFARLEVLHERAYRSTASGAPVELALEGDPGYADEASALELSLRNAQNTTMHRLVLELQLPSGALFEASARDALLSRGVSSIELRDGGLLRATINALGGGATLSLPLAVRWVARGSVRGFGAVVYEEAQPWRTSVRAPQSFELRVRPDEETVAH